MNDCGLIGQLKEAHQTLQHLTSRLEDCDCRTQHHKDLSPLGWHYGHIVYIENLWLRERLAQQTYLSADDHRLYDPRHTTKQQRGATLPEQSVLLEQGARRLAENIALLEDLPPTLKQHPLMKDNYLLKFLIQHHAQHIETMRMVITQYHCSQNTPQQRAGLSEAAAVKRVPLVFEQGAYRIGGTDNWSFDNELPRHATLVKSFAINRLPVSNTEYLGFIESGAYQQEHYWDTAAWDWLQATQTRAPNGWRLNESGWCQATVDGYQALRADAPVHGVCHFEAQAFARYAEARLPHEYEWEAAYPQLQQRGLVWEWCCNTLHPYPGFQSFPYKEYSTPWFDKQHYILRGGSRFSEPPCLRASFRNFYQREKRHIFAGLRLAYTE